MHAFVRLAPLLLAAAGSFAQAQGAPKEVPKELPKDLHGRWTAVVAGSKPVSQPFDLENIQRKEDGTFAARLTWTTADPRCIVRYQPMTGRVTPSGLSFETVTKCDVAISAELAQQGSTWVGKATSKATPPTVMDLTAK
jgi:hypothetical protein